VSPRPGNCLVGTYRYSPLKWWSDDYIASTHTTGHGIESLSVAKPHMTATNAPAALPGVMIMHQNGLTQHLVSAVLGGNNIMALENGSASQLDVCGENHLAVRGDSSSALHIVVSYNGVVPCDATGRPTGRTAARLENDFKAAEALHKREAGLENTVDNFPPVNGSTVSPSTAEPDVLYAEVAAGPASDTAVAAAAALKLEKQQKQMSWTRGAAKKKNWVPMKVETVLTPRHEDEEDEDYGNYVVYDDTITGNRKHFDEEDN